MAKTSDSDNAQQGPPVCLFGPGGDFTKEWPPRTRAAGPTASADYNAAMKATGPLLRAVAVAARHVRLAQCKFFRTRDGDDMRRAMVLEQDLDRGLLVIFGGDILPAQRPTLFAPESHADVPIRGDDSERGGR